MTEPERPQMTIRLVRFVCWISKATRATQTLTHRDTHRGMCDTYSFSTATVVSGTRLNVKLYVHCLSCFCVRVGLSTVICVDKMVGL